MSESKKAFEEFLNEGCERQFDFTENGMLNLCYYVWKTAWQARGEHDAKICDNYEIRGPYDGDGYDITMALSEEIRKADE